MHYENQHMTDRELLLLTTQTVRKLDNTIHGNGRPGLVERVTALESRVEPRSKAKTGGIVASVVAGVLAFLWNLRQAVT